MRNAELEARIWCPSCKVAKYEIYRVPLANQHVYQHVTEPADLTNYQMKYCECGTVLERKPNG